MPLRSRLGDGAQELPNSAPRRKGVPDNVTSLKAKSPKVDRILNTSRIYLLGTMQAVDRPGGKDILPTSKKTLALFGYLCMARGERLTRGHLAGMIWETSTERQARDNLRHSLAELERVGSWKIHTDMETVCLDTSACWVDVFEVPRDSSLLLRDLYGAVSTEFDYWLLRERTRLETWWLARLEERLDALIAQNAAPGLRVNAAREILNFVPMHESAVRSLMIAFADRGDCALAIREYERFRLLLRESDEELSPSPQTVALYDKIRRSMRGTASSEQVPITEQVTEASVQPKGVLDLIKVGSGGEGPPRGPSIAVIPFRNLPNEPTHDYITEGIIEDLVEGLSRVPSLFVVSRFSAAAFRNQERPPQEVGVALGVQYILTGSVRIEGERLRLTVELADTRTGGALWHARFDEKISDLLTLQSRIAESVVRSVAPRVHFTELSRVQIKRPGNYDAYDLFLRGVDSMHKPSREVFETAGTLLEAAIGREPRYATALAYLAHWHVLRVGQGWSSDPSYDTDQADLYAQQAVDCDAMEPMAYAVQAHVAAYLHKDFPLAFARFEAGLRLNPNNARAWLWNGYTHAWADQGSLAVEKVNKAIALSPYDPLIYSYSGGAGLAYMANEEYMRAIEFALRCMGENPGYTTAHKVLICSMMLSGRDTDALGVANQLLRLEPRFTVDGFRRNSPAGVGPRGELYCEAFSKAGVPLKN